MNKLVLLSLVITNFTWAQGVSKYGKVTTTVGEYVNKNGAIGSATGVNKNGQVVVAVALPDVITTDITALNGSGATSGATITYSGTATIIAKGLCWSTAADPTINLITKTTESADINSFSSNITGLTAKTKYYVRAYITTNGGTAYGDEIIFRTLVPGDDFEGGKVGYIFGIGWPVYNKNVQQAYIYRKIDGLYKWGNNTNSVTALADNGAGPANTQAIVDSQGNGTYGAKLCADLSVEDAGVTYDDWFLPSRGDMASLAGLRQNLGWGQSDRLMTSTQSTASGNFHWNGYRATTNNYIFYDSGDKTFAGYRIAAVRISSAQ